MPDVTVNKDLILTEVNNLLNLPEFKAQIARLKELRDEGINPFKPKADGSPEGWAGLVEATAILSDVVHAAVVTAEKVCAEVGAVAAGQAKLEAVAEFLDKVIVLPFYLEPFDKPLIKGLISLAVKGLEKLFGKDWWTKIPVPTTGG